METKNMNRLNIGCGMTPTKGWRNLDNSLSIRIAKWGLLGILLHKFRLISTPSLNNIKFCQSNKIEWADATRYIPASTESVDVLYTSHMLEHLDRDEASAFLKEAKRVLRSNGIIRIAVPDIKQKVSDYIKSNDADSFIQSTHMCVDRPRTLDQRLRMLIVGNRHHQWMYDGDSLSRLLIKTGFKDPIVLKAGETTIIDPGLLDLAERIEESVYVEAKKL
jgi:predicted SAM-dependent methyltransferase